MTGWLDRETEAKDANVIVEVGNKQGHSSRFSHDPWKPARRESTKKMPSRVVIVMIMCFYVV